MQAHRISSQHDSERFDGGAITSDAGALPVRHVDKVSGLAGAKDDRRDAQVLADALRTDRQALRRLSLDDPLAIELRIIEDRADAGAFRCHCVHPTGVGPGSRHPSPVSLDPSQSPWTPPAVA